MSPQQFTIMFYVVVIGAIIITVLQAQRLQKKRIMALQAVALKNGYIYSNSVDQALLVLASFRDGRLANGVSGNLMNSMNTFTFLHQNETRGSGKSRRTYNRTVVAIDIPDTQLQLVVNSKINNDVSSGGNLLFHKEQRLQVEGTFSDFFEIYMPPSTQIETLTMLAPDSLLFIQNNFIDYDIEIHGNKLFVYTYKTLWAEEFELLIGVLDGLVAEMRLRSFDTRAELQTEALVARTATAADTTVRTLRRKRSFYIFLIGLSVFIFTFFKVRYAHFIILIIYVVLGLAALIPWIRERSLKEKYRKAHTLHKQ